MIPDTSLGLLERLQREQFDEAAWQEFVSRYGEVLLHWARRWGADETDARDVTQDVLLSMVQYMRAFHYDPLGSFRAWLKKVAYHALGKLRADQRRCAALGGSGATALFQSLLARDDLVILLERQAETELLDIAMQRVRSRVQPQTWEAFRLLALECQTGEAVAARLGVSLGSVYVARHKIKKMLQAELQQLLGE